MLEAVLDLKRRNVVVAANVECVRCDVFQGAFDFAGGGCYGSKDYPKAKEQADYNLKYRIAVALLDDQVGPAQLQPARIQAPTPEVRPTSILLLAIPESSMLESRSAAKISGSW